MFLIDEQSLVLFNTFNDKLAEQSFINYKKIKQLYLPIYISPKTTDRSNKY